MIYGNKNISVWDIMSGNDSDSDVAVILENDDCKVLKITGRDGEGVMTVYKVFEGVFITYNDFHMSECNAEFSNSDSLLCINHCREGRIEMHGENGSLYYVEKGDMRIDNMQNSSGSFYFPLSHYHGISIAFESSLTEKALKEEMPGFSFDFATLSDKFCNNERPFVIRDEPAVDQLFYQLYQLPGKVQRDYFKIKIMELLLYLGNMDIEPYRVERPYFYAGQIEKIRAIHDLITSDLTKTYTAEELSKRFSIGLTAMKRCFKSTYGSPIYTYLKHYRLKYAAKLLITRRDLKVSEIGSMVGYNSPSKFTAVFHEMMDETPLEYRKSHELEL